jgi:hypothetical protein
VALIGTRYIQASSSNPGAVGFGYEWWQSDTGAIYYRAPDNSGWVLLGNVGSANLGLAPVSGFTAGGALLGSHGLIPVAATSSFTNTPNVKTGSTPGVLMALMSDVDHSFDALNPTIEATVTKAFSAFPIPSIRANIATWSGRVGPAPGNYFDAVTIPINATYPDGTVPTPSECFVSVAPVSIYVSSDQATQLQANIGQYYNTAGPLDFYCYTTGHTNAAQVISYTVIAIKASA